jgi:predicted dehydrogenase
MKFLIAGFGSIGRRHFQNLLALGEKDIILYRTGKSTLPDEELDGFTIETDFETALANRPDAVIIANPTAMHMDVAVPAAAAGCHILVEKPVSHDLVRVGELQAALDRSGARLLVGFMFRFHPGLQQVKAWMDAGAVGAPLSVRAHWGEYLPDWHPWEDYRKGYAARADLGGGVVRTLSHPLDYLLWLLGDAEVAAAATSNLGLNLEVEDCADILLRFKRGTLGSVHLDYVQRPPAHSLEITGSEGLIRWDFLTGATMRYVPEGDHWEKFDLPVGFDRNELFLAQMRHFLAVVRGEADPICTLAEGVRVQTLIEAVYAAAEGA